YSGVSSISGCGVLRWPVQHDLSPVALVNGADLLTELPLETVHAKVKALQLVLEPDHVLDAGEVQAELGRQLLDQAQPFEVELRVQARPARCARRAHQAPGLVHPQRLRVHADELGGDGDHVARPVGAHPSLLRWRRRSSRAMASMISSATSTITL